MYIILTHLYKYQFEINCLVLSIREPLPHYETGSIFIWVIEPTTSENSKTHFTMPVS
jgi:hypothetical protein